MEYLYFILQTAQQIEAVKWVGGRGDGFRGREEYFDVFDVFRTGAMFFFRLPYTRDGTGKRMRPAMLSFFMEAY